MLTKRLKMTPEPLLVLLILSCILFLPCGASAEPPVRPEYRLSVCLLEIPRESLDGQSPVILSRDEAQQLMAGSGVFSLLLAIAPDTMFRADSLRLQGILRMTGLDAESGTLSCSVQEKDKFYHSSAPVPFHTPVLLPNQMEDDASPTVTCLLLGLAAIDEDTGAEWGDSE